MIQCDNNDDDDDNNNNNKIRKERDCAIELRQLKIT